MAKRNYILIGFTVLFLLIFIAGFMYAIIDIQSYDHFCESIFGWHSDHFEQDLGFVLPFLSLFLALGCLAFTSRNK